MLYYSSSKDIINVSTQKHKGSKGFQFKVSFNGVVVLTKGKVSLNGKEYKIDKLAEAIPISNGDILAVCDGNSSFEVWQEGQKENTYNIMMTGKKLLMIDEMVMF